MHRNKLHQGSNSTGSPTDLTSKRHLNNSYSSHSIDSGADAHHESEENEACQPENKKLKYPNFTIDSIGVANDVNSSIRNISVVKDEDPSSVTSSGCSPPLKSNPSSPRQGREPDTESEKNRHNFSENQIKNEPSSTKENHHNRSSHGNDEGNFLSIRSVNNSPKFGSVRNEEKQGTF
jgi:hypothetical protein